MSGKMFKKLTKRRKQQLGDWYKCGLCGKTVRRFSKEPTIKSICMKKGDDSLLVRVGDPNATTSS